MGSQGGSSTTKAEIEKSVLGISLFPINIRIFKELKLSVGGELSYLVGSEVTGGKSNQHFGTRKLYQLQGNKTAFFKHLPLESSAELPITSKCIKITIWFLV
ncbi:MAG: hypothetical protein IPK08_23875 [Bacteroidetes bacterium]|nr:hypothetical protein [Bacteroidota bacterium]